jgi:hypothetical protein
MAEAIDFAMFAVSFVILVPMALIFHFPVIALQEWIKSRWPDSDRARAARFWIGLLAPVVWIVVLSIALAVAIIRLQARIDLGAG